MGAMARRAARSARAPGSRTTAAGFLWAPKIRSFRSGFEPGIQAARALAAMTVVFVHLFSIGVATPHTQFVGYLKWDILTRDIRLDKQDGATVAVFLFFMVSGYIVSQVAVVERGVTFLAKRAARIVPAMMFAVAFAVAVGTTLHAIGRPTWYLFDTDHALSWRAVLEGLGFGAIRPIRVLFPLWTLAVEYYWYFLLFMFMRLARNRPVLSTLMMQLGVFLLYWVAPVVAFRSFGLERAWIVPLGIILIGRWVYLVRCGLGLIPGVAGALTAFGSYIYLESSLPGVTNDIVVTDALAVVWGSAIFCTFIALLRRPLWAPINTLADLSYGIYLFHIPIAWVLLTVLVPKGGTWMLPVVLLSFAATVGFAYLSYTFIETPIRNRVRDRLRRRTASAHKVAAQPAIAARAKVG